MNVVNFSDGVDGLAAGLCTIDGVAFAIIAFDLNVGAAGILAALTAGASLGFLFHNFHPANVFMGDSGSNLLGYLLGVVAVIGSLKTNVVVALVVPLFILAVPFLDTGFVIAKRLKYKRKPWSADANHFHHRMARIGFSQRKTVAYLYGWTLMLATLAVALRVVPYHDHGPPHHYHLGWVLLMVALAADRPRRQRVPRLRARDLQVQAAARARAAADGSRPRASTRSTSRSRTTSRPVSSTACDSGARGEGQPPRAAAVHDA